MEQMDRAVTLAETAISSAYWDACDALRTAVDPADLTEVPWVREYLAEAYKIALAIKARHEPWIVAREFFLPGN